MTKVAVVVGTRPEAIKLAPVIAALRADARFNPVVIASGQHRELLAQALEAFNIIPEVNLDLMQADQSLDGFMARGLEALGGAFDAARPDWVIVQGDTTTVLAAALAAFYRRIPVAHVEAGLRTHLPYSPFPEETNRVLTTHLTRLHFAPTDQARDNLLREGIAAERITVTGNTVIDAVLMMRDALASGTVATPAWIGELRGRVMLVTAHRRENFGAGMQSICAALVELHDSHPELEIVWPVHLNPHVAGPVRAALGNAKRIHLVEPQDYAAFVALMARSAVILSDSGGVQEEAPALNVPVLVMRDASERPEAIAAGAARLVGSDTATIVAGGSRLLNDPAEHAAMAAAVNPFGDGRAAERIVAGLGAAT